MVAVRSFRSRCSHDRRTPRSSPLTANRHRTLEVTRRGTAATGHKSHVLCEEGDSRHRVRAEHDNHELLVHISEKEEIGGTTLALDQTLARGR
jgi:hypothetical protein